MVSNFTKIGSLQKSFGTDGFLRYKVLPEFKLDLKSAKFLFMMHDDYYVPYRIVELQAEKKLIHLDDVNDQEAASAIQSQDLFLPSDDLDVKEEDQSDFLVGYKLYDNEDFISTVIEVRTIAGYYYAVLNYNDKEVLIPVHEELMLELNPDEKLVRMDLPEGILDL